METQPKTSWQTYAALPPQTARVCRLLAALPPARWDVNAAAAVCSLSPQETAAQLHALCTARLMHQQANHPGHYEFHGAFRGLARTFAEQHEKQPAREEALVLWLDWMLATVSSAERLLTPWRQRLSCALHDRTSLTSAKEAWAWLTAHQDDLQAAVTAAQQHRQLSWVPQLVRAAWPLFHRLRPWTVWLDLHQQAVSAAAACGQPEEERALLTSGAMALRGLGDPAEASGWAYRSLASATRAQDHHSRADALVELAQCQAAVGGTSSAIRLLNSAMGIRQRPPVCDPHGVTACRLVLAEVHLHARQLDVAHTYAAGVAQEMTESGDAFSTGRALTISSRIHAQLGEHEKSLNLLHQALDLFTATGAAPYQADVHASLGEAARQQGHPRQAASHFRNAQLLYQRVDPHAAGRMALRIRALRAPIPLGPAPETDRVRISR
ncbi:tetratricopeptide repeat protein [Streptomyces venezuelae]|uniref:tetratricopeptide repeat protein n=1 Tax=Streptomyces venezuelae TaxID=54571 RepID=UPI00344A9A26